MPLAHQAQSEWSTRLMSHTLTSVPVPHATWAPLGEKHIDVTEHLPWSRQSPSRCASASTDAWPALKPLTRVSRSPWIVPGANSAPFADSPWPSPSVRLSPATTVRPMSLSRSLSRPSSSSRGTHACGAIAADDGAAASLVAPIPGTGRAAARDVGLGVAAAAVAVAVELEQLACAAGLLDFDAVREVGEQAVLRKNTPREMEKTRTD